MFIDWSDAAGMLDLFLDFIADEREECEEDPERSRFLSELDQSLKSIDLESTEPSPATLLPVLRDMRESIDPAFENDPAVVHLQDLMDELTKIEAGDA